MALGPFEIGILLVGIFAILTVALVRMAYLSNGRITGVTARQSDEFINDLEEYLVLDGWKQGHRGNDLLLMEKGPSGCMGLLLLVIFLPLGLVYLLTDWGRAKLAVSFRPDERGGTEFQIDWRGAAIRQGLRAFLGLPR